MAPLVAVISGLRASSLGCDLPVLSADELTTALDAVWQQPGLPPRFVTMPIVTNNIPLSTATADLQALGLVVTAVPTPGNFGSSCDPAVDDPGTGSGRDARARACAVLLAVNLDLDYSSTPGRHGRLPGLGRGEPRGVRCADCLRTGSARPSVNWADRRARARASHRVRCSARLRRGIAPDPDLLSTGEASTGTVDGVTSALLEGEPLTTGWEGYLDSADSVESKPWCTICGRLHGPGAVADAGATARGGRVACVPR